MAERAQTKTVKSDITLGRNYPL